MPHAVARLRDERLAKSLKPFVARGSRAPRCLRCRVPFSHCLCPWLPRVDSECGVCLLMHDIEPLKPSNTGWLIADVVLDTFAFTWQRTGVDPRLLDLLADPQWQPLVIFPGEYAAPQRVVERVERQPDKRPLFILLDATWTEARKMFRKSPYLDGLPVLSLQPEALSRYRLRRSTRSDHLCTAEVAALCLELAGDSAAANTLDAWLDVFTEHYLGAKHHRQPDLHNAAHRALQVPDGSA
ncbi:tRNA-uridine aminocarboxypropyltransferase [Stutzerimonas stutzeri]|jgi:DTW domain-containing protein|uniref:tRNA-uridine aminocarboxypropyltransferase n=1 Tax=Stutzerimonas stutzeri TaxID=316 RepID=A0AA42PCA0_STUST|nr:tRNA-uridine aminocarboxypropyltransferase [Stutzerimonas stutzeri]OHC22662.1 MAG: DTW domain-containing protein [Pseudomonadales bacterium RIFCSPHIGHO2_01_FULL_64_12]HAB86023.1 DTW domain-containing protein [Pseudomonas sp.]MCQ4224370.1 DTW domain-containing protein [Stutzerimonas stutzeri]MDH1237410.1 DTW domain-containing protein [Stutzerimonas stutzeri]MDI9728039.1 tRNA-uridine aminocarboxypropyltransferase [Stutzerimonas stutzeri]